MMAGRAVGASAGRARVASRRAASGRGPSDSMPYALVANDDGPLAGMADGRILCSGGDTVKRPSASCRPATAPYSAAISHQ
jgi:hypothetical protein